LLAENPASYLAHWFRSPEAGFEYFRGRANAPAKLEGLRLHPVPFRKIRGDAAELFDFPLRKGDTRREFGFSCPGASKKNRGKIGPNIVPLRRKSEQDYCIEIRVNSQGESAGQD
jgi:hypothetical protein